MTKWVLICCMLATAQLQAQNVGIGTTAPAARLHVADSSVVFTSNSGLNYIANPPVQGPGKRMLWHQDKAAFRVGAVDDGTINGAPGGCPSCPNNWNRDSIGGFSFASGYNTKASGSYSTAMGYHSIASGEGSTALGASTASGEGVSTAIGNGSKARGYSSTAIGFVSLASGNFSTAIGYEATASGNNATAMGNSTARGYYSTAMGFVSEASGFSSMGMGLSTKAKAYGAFAAGLYNDTLDNPLPQTTAAADRIFQLGNGTADNARSNALTVLRNGNTGIGHTDPAFRLDISGRMRIRSGGDLNSSAGIFLNNTDNSGLPAFMGMQSNENIGFYGNTSGWSFVMNTTTGKTGIGTTTPASTLEVNGFTKLGTDAPAVKVKKLTGTTSSVEGFNVNIAHGVTASKILSVSVLVESSTNNFTPPGFTHFTGYEYNFDILNGAVWIFNVAGNSGNILSKPFKVLITYEE
jgi:Head domain of trimeric autotransporter adhesin